MYHQSLNTFGYKIYNVFDFTNCSFQKHFHRSYELIFSKKNSTDISIDNTVVTLHENEFLLIFPYVPHSLNINSDSILWICVFSANYLPDIETIREKKMALPIPFTMDDDSLAFLKTKYLNTLDHSFFEKKAYLCLIYNSFIRTAKLVDKKVKDNLISNLLEYIEKHFKEDIDLYTIAKDLNYNYQYISKVFSKVLNIKFKDILNQYRIDYADSLIEKNEMSISNIALECGYQTVRTFNRIYKEYTGFPPSKRKTT